MNKNKWSKALGAVWLLIGISLLLVSCQTTCKNDSLDFDSTVPDNILTQYAADFEKEGLVLKECPLRVYRFDLMGSSYGTASTETIIKNIEQEEPFNVKYWLTFENGESGFFSSSEEAPDDYQFLELRSRYL